MNVQGIYKGKTYKEVTIENVEEGTEDALLIGYAMRTVGETPGSIFGSDVCYVPMTTTAVVSLYIE